MQKCPNCGFEPVEGCTTCPKCGFSLQLNDQNETTDLNDSIEWSKLADMPIETVQKMFNDKHKQEEEKTEEIPEMNPILAQYIRQHKEGYEEEEPTEPSKPSAEETPAMEEVEESIEETSEVTEPAAESSVENVTEEVPEEAPVIESESEATEEQPKADPAESMEEPMEDVEVEEMTEEVTEEPHEANNVIETEAVETAKEDTEEHFEEEAVPSHEETKKEPSLPEPQKSKKGHKKVYLALAAVVVLGAGGYYYHHEKEVEAQRIATVKKENKALDTIEASMASYYTDDQQTFLAADKVKLNPSKIAEELAGYKDHKRYDELTKDYEELVAKQTAEQSVDQLFTEPVIEGDQLAEKPLLKTAEPVALTVDTGDQKFDDLLNQAVDQAKAQYNQIENSKKAVSGLLKDGKVNDSVSREQYNKADQALKAVANQSLVQSQKEDLQKVDQMLKDKEKKAAEEKAAKEKAEQEAKAAEEKQAQTSNSGQNVDASSDAFTWNPGVKEKVIQTCISRGYIVEGGYSLEPVRAENGEGYYNLYATSNRASLTKGYTDADLPMYLVTINCKTGYFKGNGPN